MRKHVVPFLRAFHRDKGTRDLGVLRVELGVLDAELSHQGARALVAIRLPREREMFCQDIALLEETGPTNGLACNGVPHLPEDPRIADRTPGDTDAVEPCAGDHFDAGCRRK